MYICMYIHTYNVCMHANLRCIDEIAVLIHNIMRIIRILCTVHTYVCMMLILLQFVEDLK